MLWEEFKCCMCGHLFNPTGARLSKTSALPGAIFYGTGDTRGLWVNFEDNIYCDTCSDQRFPQILREDVKFSCISKNY